jgi:hypothetical protein
MDNGAYEKYRAENPVVNIPLSTYDYLELFVHEMTYTELAICGVALVLAVYALYKLATGRKKPPTDE